MGFKGKYMGLFGKIFGGEKQGPTPENVEEAKKPEQGVETEATETPDEETE